MSTEEKVAELLAIQNRIQQLKAQQQSPVERIRFPNGSDVTFRSMSDIDVALRNAERELESLESPSTVPTRARRVYLRPY